MKFTVDTKKLLEALSKINKIVAAKSDIPVYQDVLIEAKDKKVYLTGSNTVSRIRVTLPLEINAFDEGQCCVPASLLFDLVKTLFEDHPESVSFDIKIQELTKLLNRASVLTKHSSVPLLTFSFDTQNESVELATKKVTTGNIKEELPIDKFVASGNGYTVCFNINYLLQVLRFSYDSKAKKIHFSFNDALRYFTITDADNPNSGLCQIISPVGAA